MIYRQLSGSLRRLYSSLVLPVNKRLMHHIAARPTRLYIILANTASCPPHIQATRSNLNKPISPQLIPPMIDSMSAMLLTVFNLITSINKVTDSINPPVTFYSSKSNICYDYFTFSFYCIFSVICRNEKAVAFFEPPAVYLSLSVYDQDVIK